MNKLIYCIFLKKKSESLEHQCYPGELGKKIFNNISKKAWEEWKKKQTILINEKKLNMANTNHRKKLEQEMVNFLFNNKSITNK